MCKAFQIQKMLFLMLFMFTLRLMIIISGNKAAMALSQRLSDACLPTSLSLRLCWIVHQRVGRTCSKNGL